MATWHHNQEDKNLIPDEVPLNCPFADGVDYSMHIELAANEPPFLDNSAIASPCKSRHELMEEINLLAGISGNGNIDGGARHKAGEKLSSLIDKL